MKPTEADLSQYKRITPAERITLGGWAEVSVDESTGALCYLKDLRRSGRVWASSGQPLFLTQYQVNAD